MHVQFTTFDSTGTAVTESLTLTFEGERHTISVADTGTASVPKALGEYLIESGRFAVVPYDDAEDSDDEIDPEAATGDDSGNDSDSDSDDAAGDGDE